ncbi:2973_t:CDS:1, partial [Cetraspora pellucida]
MCLGPLSPCHCAKGFKCSEITKTCINETSKEYCTQCGQPYGSNGPCCAPGIKDSNNNICYCATGRIFCSSNDECQKGLCCQRSTGSCIQDPFG